VTLMTLIKSVSLDLHWIIFPSHIF